MAAPVKRSATQNSTSVRSRLNDQLSRLQVKHNAEIELMEDIKTFSKQRALLDKQYAESLQRLVGQFASKREIKPPPTVPGMDRIDNRGVMEMWKTLVDKTGEMAKYKLTSSDLLLTKVSDVMKQQRRTKEGAYKRLIEIAQRMNTEILESVKEATTARKSYSELEKLSEEARSKFNEAETKLKKKELKFYESMSGVEKAHKKASDRLKSCQKRTTVSRNDYLLSVGTTNSHILRHSTVDLPELMKALDGEFYERARDVYMLYAQIEADAANFIKAEFEDLREQAYLVNREYNLQCYLITSPVLKERIEYNFEPWGEDKVTGINKDHGAEIFLDKDARKWASKLTKDQQAIALIEKQIKGLRSVTTAYTKNPEFGTSESFTEAQANIESLREDIRQLEVHTTKAECRLASLREAGVDVAKWLQKAGDVAGKAGDTNSLSSLTPSRLSQLSVQDYGSQEFDIDTSSLHSGAQDGDSISIGSEDHSPKMAIVIYDYNAQHSDELSVTADEEVEVLEWDDGDGWTKGRNKAGSEGFFPQSYVQYLPSRSASPHTTVTPAQPKQVRALYEYTAQFDEELSFPEGAVIELMRTDDNGIDDGWWEGQYEGRVGVFPSVVVDLIPDGVVTPPNGVHDSTLVGDMFTGPPPDSPPPLPPDYPPPSITQEELSTGAIGPPPAIIKDSPSLRIQNPTPEPQDRDTFMWKDDSFDDF